MRLPSEGRGDRAASSSSTAEKLRGAAPTCASPGRQTNAPVTTDYSVALHTHSSGERLFVLSSPRGGSRQGRQPAGRESPGRAANGGAAVAAPSPRSAGGGAASGGRAGGAAGAPPAGGAPAARRARRPLGGARGSAAGSGELGPTAQGAEQGQCSYFLFYFILF